MKDEIFNKWCSECGVVTTTLSAKCCPHCGNGPLEDTGGCRYVKVIVELPDFKDMTQDLTTVEAHYLFDWFMNHESIILDIKINENVQPVITSVNGKLLKGD